MTARPKRLWYLLATTVGALGLALGTTVAVQASTAARSASPAVACAANTTVRTTDGPVCGTVLSNGVSNGSAFLRRSAGRRPALAATAAAGPVDLDAGGDLVRRASAFRTSRCRLGGRHENCLFVNVWAPQSATAGENLPVMVHIHGGGFCRRERKCRQLAAGRLPATRSSSR